MNSAGTMSSWPASQSAFEHHHARSMESYHDTYNMESRHMSQSAMPPQPGTLVQVCSDAKPRLTKDQHEILESHFRRQNKPSTSIKKGYADALGVPLDKINNWFQNRRAKVKQEAKKQLNQMQLYQSIGHHPQHYMTHPPQVSPRLPMYYGPLPVVPSNNELLNEPSSDPQATIATHNLSMPQTSMPSSGFSLEATDMSAMPHGLPFGAHDFAQMPQQQQIALPGINFGSTFENDMMNMPENYDFFQMSDSAGAQDGMSSMASTSMSTPASMNASPSAMPQLISAYVPQGYDNESKPRFQVDSPQDPAEFSSTSDHPTPAESTTTWSTNAPGQEMYELQQYSTPALIQSQESPEVVEPYVRRASSTLTDSMHQVDFDASSSESESGFMVSSQISGLAARRQRPRPANLVSTAFRSASFTAGMPGSPGANANPNSQDQLRRIRSHGMGLATGRVSKPNGPQKSPMHANFDATVVNSPKFARHTSNLSVSTINSSGPLTATTMPNTLAPPTPITPSEFARFPVGQIYPYRFPDSSPGAFSYMGDEGNFYDTSSPMGIGKLDMQQLAQFRATQIARHEASLFQTPPQSAPAFQQHFGFHPQPRMLQPPTSYGQGHARRISLPDAQHGQEPTQYFNPQFTIHPEQDMQENIPPHLAEAFHADSHVLQMSQAVQAGAAGPIQFMFQPADSRLPVHFVHQSAKDFQEQKRSR